MRRTAGIVLVSFLMAACGEDDMPPRVPQNLGTLAASNIGQTVTVKPATAAGFIQVLRTILDVPQPLQLTLGVVGSNQSALFVSNQIDGLWRVRWGSGGGQLNTILIDPLLGVTIPLHASIVQVDFGLLVPLAPGADSFDLTASIGGGAHSTAAAPTFTDISSAAIANGATHNGNVPPYARSFQPFRADNASGMTMVLRNINLNTIQTIVIPAASGLIMPEIQLPRTARDFVMTNNGPNPQFMGAVFKLSI